MHPVLGTMMPEICEAPHLLTSRFQSSFGSELNDGGGVHLILYGFLRDIYQMPGIAETVNFDHIRNHYFRSHKTINPTGIISIGPWQDLDEPHGRDSRFKE